MWIFQTHIQNLSISHLKQGLSHPLGYVAHIEHMIDLSFKKIVQRKNLGKIQK
jgi:hypothetical protein